MTTAALRAVDEVGLGYRVIRHGPVLSLTEAAAARGVTPADVVKTLVVRRGDDDFLFRIAGREITLGAGEHGVAIAAAADDVVAVLGATVADISEPDHER